MEWVLIIVNVVGFFLLGLFIKNYLPSYMDEKGKNLATKEDIEEITRKTEEVKVLFQKEITIFSNELTFANNYAFNRYSLLYSRLYGIIIQSEYIRFFFKKHEIQDLNIEEFPFIEIERTQNRQQRDLFTGEKVSEERRSIDDEMTSFNKKELCDYIIKNSEYASPKLLKLAVAYRYAWSNYGGTKNIEDENISASFNESEFELIKEIVRTIIVEYNEMRKTVNLGYSEHELTTGKLEHIEFK